MIMPTLLDRISRSTNDNNQDLRGHNLEMAITMQAKGYWARPKALSVLGLTGAPAPQLVDFDKFKARYDAVSPALAKVNWLLDLTAVVAAIQAGELSKANFNTHLGLDLDET